MGQSLAELAAQQKAIREAAAGKKADPPMDGLKAAAPPTTVKIVGGGKTPKEIEHDKAVKRHDDARAEQNAKAKQKKAEKTGSLR